MYCVGKVIGTRMDSSAKVNGLKVDRRCGERFNEITSNITNLMWWWEIKYWSLRKEDKVWNN